MVRTSPPRLPALPGGASPAAGPFDVRAASSLLRVLTFFICNSCGLSTCRRGAVSLCKPPGGLPGAGVPDLLASRADAPLSPLATPRCRFRGRGW